MNLDMIVADLENYIITLGNVFGVQYIDDYKQEVLLQLFEKGDDYIKDKKRNGKLKSYTYTICLRMLSHNGKYHTKFIKPNKGVFELNGNVKRSSNDKKFNTQYLADMVDTFSGTEKTLLQHYIICHGKKINLSKKSNISYATICKMMKGINEKIKLKYNIDDFYD